MTEMEKDDIEGKLSRAKKRRKQSRVLFYIFIAIALFALFILYSPQGNGLGTSFTLGLLFFSLAVAAIIAMGYYGHQVKKYTKQSDESASRVQKEQKAKFSVDKIIYFFTRAPSFR